MFPTIGRELSKIRVESLREEGSPRTARSPGRVRRVLGQRFVVAGERLLGECRERSGLRIEGGA